MMYVRMLSDNTKSYLDEFFKVFEEMRDEMAMVSPTQSISETFIMQMIPHHEAAIKMSENILKYTTNTQIEELAKDIIESQSKDIENMKGMLGNCALVKNDERDIVLYEREFLKIFEIMISKMDNSETGNNLNVDFLTEMIPHHEGAINMSKNLLQFNICGELKEIAENIITSQSKQLMFMKNLLRQID